MSVTTPQKKKLSTTTLAVVVLGIVVGALVAGIAKPQLTTWFAQLGGSPIRHIHFASDNFLLEDASKVKVAGVVSGVVDSAVPAPGGGADVTVVVDRDAIAAVGDTPSARIRPSTLLGGLYYIEIVPGGDRAAEWSADIPQERSSLPTELDDVAERLQPDQLDGARSAISDLNDTLDEDGREPLHALLADSPEVLRPAGGVLNAALGTRPDTDLPALVGSLQKASSVLTSKEGQLDAVIGTLQDTSEVFADTSPAVASAIRDLPGVLDTAQVGLSRLDGSLDRLADTAEPARPSIQALSSTLDTALPVLTDARPLVGDLKLALQDTRPLVEGLVPASAGLTRALDDLSGPVLDRVNGPIKDNTFAPFKGEGAYQHTQGDAPFYQELGYMFTGVAKAGAYVDPNGHAVAFHPGAGLGTVSGVGPVSLEQMFQQLFHGGTR